MKKIIKMLLLITILLFYGCATYDKAYNYKRVSYDDREKINQIYEGTYFTKNKILVKNNYEISEIKHLKIIITKDNDFYKFKCYVLVTKELEVNFSLNGANIDGYNCILKYNDFVFQMRIHFRVNALVLSTNDHLDIENSSVKNGVFYNSLFIKLDKI